MALLVNGEAVDDELIRQETKVVRDALIEAQVDEDPFDIELRARDWARENVIERVLLRQAAMSDPEPLPSEAIDGAMQQETDRAKVEAALRMERLVNKVTAKAPAPKKKDVIDLYRKSEDKFYTPEMVHAAHIVRNIDETHDEAVALASIEAAQTELNNGRDFAAVADELSDCPGRGGDLGWFERGSMVEEFETVAFGLEPGRISPIFRTPFGFHIVKVYDRKPAGLRPLNEVRGQIETALLQANKEKLLEDYVDALRAKADIRKAV